MTAWLPLLMLGLACDGEDTGYIATDGVLVDGLKLRPEPATVLDTLRCEWEGLQGATTATVAWEINGVVIAGLEDPTLDATWFNKKDKVACVVTPDEPSADSTRSNVIKIADAPPEVTSVVITPEDANKNHILHAVVESSDPDSSDELRLNGHFKWYVAGEGEEPEQRGVDEDALGQTYWDKYDTVWVEAWVVASGEPSKTIESDRLVIGNAPPQAPTVQVEAADDLSSLSCTVVEESVDLDGDEVSYTYNWRRFGIEIAVEEAVLTFPDPGASYTCIATPTDGEDDGASGADDHEVAGDPLRYRWVHDDAGAHAGDVMVRFPDVDGDGRDDLLVSVISASVDSVEGGGVILMDSETVKGSSESLPGSAWVYRTLTSPNQQQHFGTALAWAPDLDGDGLAEIIVGAPQGEDVDRVMGLVAIVPSGTWSETDSFSMSIKQEQDAMWWYPGDTDGAEMGRSVAGLDANQDGTGDVSVGALYQHGSDQGNVTVIDGSLLGSGGGPVFNDAVLVEISGNGGLFGWAQTVGDFDGDGLADLAVGAPDDADQAGVIYVFTDIAGFIPEPEDNGDSGPGPRAPYVSADDSSATLEGGQSGDGIGAVLAAGDLSGDGLDDLLVGSTSAESGAGAIYLWIGGSSSTGWQAYTAVGAEADAMGASVSPTGDLDGGGIGDVITGAKDNESTYARGGGAYVFSGEDWGASGGTLTAEDALWFLPAESEGERSGTAVLGIGDLDGDGQLDLAVSAPALDDDDVGVDVGGLNLWVSYDEL